MNGDCLNYNARNDLDFHTIKMKEIYIGKDKLLRLIVKLIFYHTNDIQFLKHTQ